MTLDAYLIQNALKDADFAVRVDCDRTTIYRIRARGQRPSPDLMERIARETSGLVQPNDFYGLSGLAA